MHGQTLKPRILFTIVFLMGILACSSDPKPQKNNSFDDKIEVNWTWKRTANKSANVVYGTIKNKTPQPIQKVELEFRTQDAKGTTIQSFIFGIENFKANEQKPFTQDYPAQAAKEDSGFVTVKNVISAN